MSATAAFLPALLLVTHTHKPQRLQFHVIKEKKEEKKERSLPSYVILSNCTVQLTSEDLLTCQAGHMLNTSLKSCQILPHQTLCRPPHPHCPHEVLRACPERTLLHCGSSGVHRDDAQECCEILVQVHTQPEASLSLSSWLQPVLSAFPGGRKTTISSGVCQTWHFLTQHLFL